MRISIEGEGLVADQLRALVSKTAPFALSSVRPAFTLRIANCGGTHIMLDTPDGPFEQHLFAELRASVARDERLKQRKAGLSGIGQIALMAEGGNQDPTVLDVAIPLDYTDAQRDAVTRAIWIALCRTSKHGESRSRQFWERWRLRLFGLALVLVASSAAAQTSGVVVRNGTGNPVPVTCTSGCSSTSWPTASGTVTNTGDTVTITDTKGAQTLSIQATFVSGVPTQNDLVEGSTDGTNWVSLPVFAMNAASCVPAGTTCGWALNMTTFNNTWLANIGGYAQARVRHNNSSAVYSYLLLTSPANAYPQYVVSPTASNFNAQVIGNVADNSSPTGNPVRVAGTFSTTQPTYATINRVANLQSSSRGALIVNPGVETFQVQANAGTNLNTSALALESGGNLASINTKLVGGTTIGDIRLRDGAGTAITNTGGRLNVQVQDDALVSLDGGRGITGSISAAGGTVSTNNTIFASYNANIVSISGTWSGTLEFRVTGTNGIGPLVVKALDLVNGTYVSSTTANGLFVLPAASTQVDVRASAWTSGTANIGIAATQAITGVPTLVDDGGGSITVDGTVAVSNTAFGITQTGSNNDVDVLTLPNVTLSQTGSANDVDVLTLPAVTLSQTGTNNDVDVASLPFTALTYNSPTSATVGVSSAQALAANASRKAATFINTSNNTISCAVGAAAVLNTGITLEAGAVWNMRRDSLATGAVNCIASSASSNLSIQEVQ